MEFDLITVAGGRIFQLRGGSIPYVTRGDIEEFQDPGNINQYSLHVAPFVTTKDALELIRKVAGFVGAAECLYGAQPPRTLIDNNQYNKYNVNVCDSSKRIEIRNNRKSTFIRLKSLVDCITIKNMDIQTKDVRSLKEDLDTAVSKIENPSDPNASAGTKRTIEDISTGTVIYFPYQTNLCLLFINKH